MEEKADGRCLTLRHHSFLASCLPLWQYFISLCKLFFLYSSYKHQYSLGFFPTLTSFLILHIPYVSSSTHIAPVIIHSLCIHKCVCLTHFSLLTLSFVYCGRHWDCSNEHDRVYPEMRNTAFKELKEIQFGWSTESKKNNGS